MAEPIKKSAPITGKNQRPLAAEILAYLCLAAPILGLIFFGPSPLFYLLFIALAAIFILPDNFLFGFYLIIILTMVFERYFALQGLVLDETVYKFYLLDAVICFSWLALFFSYRRRAVKTKPTFGLSGKLLLGWLLLTALYFSRGCLDLNANFDLVFSSFKNYFFYPLLYFFILYAIDSRQKLKTAIHLVLLVAAGLVGFLFLGLIRGVGLWTEFTPLSTLGTRYLASTHAFYMALALMLVLPLLFYKRLNSKPFTLMAITAWILGIGASLMRHLWLAVASGLAVLFFIIGRDFKKTYAVFLAKAGLYLATTTALALLIAGLLYFQGADKLNQNIAAITSRAATITDLSSDSSAVWRANVWTNAEKIWQTSPLTGVGFGRIMLVDNGLDQTFEEIRNIHNSPLAILVQMGLIGLTIWLAFILAVIIPAIKINHDGDLQPYRLGLIAALTVYFVTCLFQPYLETNMMGIWFWILLGFLRASTLLDK